MTSSSGLSVNCMEVCGCVGRRWVWYRGSLEVTLFTIKGESIPEDQPFPVPSWRPWVLGVKGPCPHGLVGQQPLASLILNFTNDVWSVVAASGQQWSVRTVEPTACATLSATSHHPQPGTRPGSPSPHA